MYWGSADGRENTQKTQKGNGLEQWPMGILWFCLRFLRFLVADGILISGVTDVLGISGWPRKHAKDAKGKWAGTMADGHLMVLFAFSAFSCGRWHLDFGSYRCTGDQRMAAKTRKRRKREMGWNNGRWASYGSVCVFCVFLWPMAS